MKKGQSSIEFLILVGALLFIFILFLGLFQQNISQKTIEQRNQEITELALTVKNEISLATEASDGYQRQFEIPKTLLGKDYDINVTQGSVYIRTKDGRNALALPVYNVTGEINKTTNNIRKVNGSIYLNVNPP